MIAMVALAVISAFEDERQLQEYLKTLPEEERQKVIDARTKRAQAAKEERERQEYLEAIKPHNLWSFLGLGRK